MIYCGYIRNYINQEDKCINCILYNEEEDSCDYELFNPGLKKGKND
jgi:hypothetical protein